MTKVYTCSLLKCAAARLAGLSKCFWRSVLAMGLPAGVHTSRVREAASLCQKLHDTWYSDKQ